MSTATKNAAILLAHYQRVGRATEAAGITEPTFRRALRGGSVRWSTTVKLRKAVAALTPREVISENLAKAQQELNTLHQERLNGAGAVGWFPFRSASNPTVEELMDLRQQIIEMAARLNGPAQAAA